MMSFIYIDIAVVAVDAVVFPVMNVLCFAFDFAPSYGRNSS